MQNIEITASGLANYYKENYKNCLTEISNETIGRVYIQYTNIQFVFTIDTYKNEIGYKVFEYPIIKLWFRGKNYYIIIEAINHIILTNDRLNKKLIELNRPNSEYELSVYKNISEVINTLIGLEEAI